MSRLCITDQKPSLDLLGQKTSYSSSSQPSLPRLQALPTFWPCRLLFMPCWSWLAQMTCCC